LTSKRVKAPTQRVRIWILLGLALLIAGIMGVKGLNTEADLSDERPEAQLGRALAEGTPTFAFFHSLDCDPCIQAMRRVDDVYPSFEGSVVLVDINVSDTQNHALLRRAGVRAIPTFFFYDRSGEVEIYYGVPQADQLRGLLSKLSKGD